MELKDLAGRSVVVSTSVWRSRGGVRYLSTGEIKSIQKEMSARGIRQFRYCIHSSDNEACHQMIIFHNRPQVINWHAQTGRDGQVFYMCLEGEMEIIMAAEKKKMSYRLSNDPGFSKMVSIPRNRFRRVVTLSSHSVFVEMAEGPFMDSDTIWRTSV